MFPGVRTMGEVGMSWRRAGVVGMALLATVGSASAAAELPSHPPEVLKVEPPSWWPGHSMNPVRLLVRGRNLGGAMVEAPPGSGLVVGAVKVNAAATYLFVDVHIDEKAAPGARKLVLRTAAGRTGIPFELLAPLARTGRFQGFSPDDVIYLAMPDRFANGDLANDDPPAAGGLLDRAKPRYYHGGDFKGLLTRLGYLHDLGVTALWLNPWYDNTNRLNERETYDNKPITDYHGYGAVDFYAVDEHFGDLASLRDLVDAAHARGIKVIQDQVANHSGPYHPWVKDSPTPTWYNGTEASHLANTWQTWTLHDPKATPDLQKATLQGWFIDILPDLNQDDEECARYIIQNTLWWVGISGLDGIRQDTLPYVPRRFWRDWMAAIKKEYPGLAVVGELFDGDPALVAFFQGGRARFDGIDSGVDTLFDFPAYFKIREAFAQGKPLRDLAMTLARDHLYPDPSRLVTFLGLHDVPRFMNEPGATLDGLSLAFTFLFTARGTPLVYYGDEIAMPGGGDPDNRRDFPGGWPGDPRDAFDPKGRTPSEQKVFDHVQRLARLRASLPALRRGTMVNLAVGEQSWVYTRSHEGEVVVVALNNADRPATIEAAVGRALAEGVVLAEQLSGGPDVKVDGGLLRLALPARAGLVYAVKAEEAPSPAAETAPARAASAAEVSNLRVATGVFEFNLGTARAAELSVQYRGGRKSGPFHPVAGAAVTTDRTLHVFAGFGADLPLFGRFVLRPSFAPGLYSRGRGKDLGTAFQFRSAVELAWRLGGGRHIGLELDHVSNSGYGRSNRGEESLLLTFALPIGKP